MTHIESIPADWGHRHAKRRLQKFTDPQLPRGVEFIVPPPPEACSFIDRLLVYASSLIVVGSPIWFYGGIIYLFRRWKHYRYLASREVAKPEDDATIENEGKQTQQELKQYKKFDKMARKCAITLATIIILSIWGPHRNKHLGDFLKVRKWRLWDAWLRYIGFTVLQDKGNDYNKLDEMETLSTPKSSDPEFDVKTSPAIYAFVPHGIFPFALAFACLPEQGYSETWGLFRPVVATATKLFPLVRTLISWMDGVDASRSAVSRALSLSNDAGGAYRRVGISPGGIAEMFETYPKSGFHRNDEAALLKQRNGIFKLALKHKLPIIPVYCFGATKMLRRVQLPEFMETLSRALKISLCLFFGKFGLPIPFRQKLMYVVGRAILPPSEATNALTGEQFDIVVQEMHEKFCDEIVRIFNNNKEYYGWGDKTLRII